MWCAASATMPIDTCFSSRTTVRTVAVFPVPGTPEISKEIFINCVNNDRRKKTHKCIHRSLLLGDLQQTEELARIHLFDTGERPACCRHGVRALNEYGRRNVHVLNIFIDNPPSRWSSPYTIPFLCLVSLFGIYFHYDLHRFFYTRARGESILVLTGETKGFRLEKNIVGLNGPDSRS